MPRPKIDGFWVDAITRMVANDRSIRAAEVRRRLLDEQKQMPGTPSTVPSDKTIRNVINEVRPLPEARLEPWKFFVWPSSMESGFVPWEAARTLLDYCVFREEKGMSPLQVGEARWYWRVTLAAPQASIYDRAWISMRLAMIDAAGINPENRLDHLTPFHWDLAYAAADDPRSAEEKQHPKLKITPEQGGTRFLIDKFKLESGTPATSGKKKGR